MAAMTFVLSSARDDTIAAVLFFEVQEGDVLPGDDIQVLEWGSIAFQPIAQPVNWLDVQYI